MTRGQVVTSGTGLVGAPLIHVENACAGSSTAVPVRPGRGPKLLHSAATRLGGRVPVDPSGGLVSRGHPVGATGAAQLVELVTQLRGRAGDRQVDSGRVALAENAGGYTHPEGAACVVTILSED